MRIKVSYIVHMKGHHDSSGDLAEWVIKSHETDKILSSHKSESAAKEHLKQMHSHSSEFIGIKSLDELIKLANMGYGSMVSDKSQQEISNAWDEKSTPPDTKINRNKNELDEDDIKEEESIIK